MQAQARQNVISIKNIEEAAVRLNGTVAKTPCLRNYNLSEKYDCNIFLKREDLQVVRSFKIRGAYNKMAKLSKIERNHVVVCASAGNHAQGVAFACADLKIKGKIFMPSTTPQQKVKKVQHFGKQWIEIILEGDTFDDAFVLAEKEQKQSSAIFVHPFNDLDVIAGQGTVALEMLGELHEELDYLFVAVGGGGLISGVSSYFKAKSPNTRIISVEATGAPALHNSLKAGERIFLDSIDGFADGVAVKEVGDITFRVCKEFVDDSILVDEGAICSAILSLYNDEAIVAEPAGAVSIAALEQYKDKIKGKNVGVIICGGNNDVSRTEEIRERALLWEGKKHYFIIKFPQRAGALKEFLNVLGPDDDIAHFEYTKKNNRQSGPALVGIELKNKEDFEALMQRMDQNNINYEHINDRPILFEWIV
ncbi:threonine ammonia-lyase IlvA [Saprospiraceae bacterium]|nr:threonine ammonia-lyase IlvA [Saprospiraceae bacterium]